MARPRLHTENRLIIKPIVTPAQIQALKLIVIPTDGILERIEQELVDNPALEHLEGMEELASFGEREKSKESESDNEIDPRDSLDAGIDVEDFDGGNDDFDGDNDFDFEPIQATEYEFGESSYEQESIRQYMDEDPYSYAESGASYNPDEDDRTAPMAVEKSYYEHLCEQVELLDLETETQRLIADQIVGTIDNQGYLTRDIEGIIRDIRVYSNVVVEKKEVLHILHKVQRFDPPGSGARDLRDCLLIQLRILSEMGGLRPSDREKIEKAYIILDEYFEEFKKKHYPRLQRALGLKREQDLHPYLELILKLNPKPASGFSTREMAAGNYIMPDFTVKNADDELVLELHARNAPELRVNDAYQEQLKSIKDKRQDKKMTNSDLEAYTFIKSKIDSARWFIDAIKQRQDTMMRTMQAIMIHQYEFFKTGDARKMKPMILKDIAEVTGLDISTVSRVANSKFVQTEYGTKRIKEFFSESLQTEDGEEVSTLEVKEILKEIIAKESQVKPLSDEKIRSMLMKKGYNIARRTVAKYRESLNIPVARMRKELGAE
jgi:RNA polymerase sigma-54 factor